MLPEQKKLRYSFREQLSVKAERTYDLGTNKIHC